MKKPNLAAMTPEVAKAIEEMMAEQGERFSLEKVNLAELARRTGLSRQKLRRMKTHNFEDTQHAAKGRKSPATLLSGYTGLLDGLLRSGVTNSAVCLSRLKENGYMFALHQRITLPGLLGFTQNSPKETGRNSQTRIKRKSHYSKPFKSFILNSDQTTQ